MSQNLGEQLGQGLDIVIRAGKKRLDRSDALSLLVDIEWDTQGFAEMSYIHYVRLVAMALDKSFQDRVQTVIGDRLVGRRTSHNGIKSFMRMLNKMRSADDHLHDPRPRPAQNVDCVRLLAAAPTWQALRECARIIDDVFEGAVKVKNGFAMTEEEADKMFNLRLVLISVLHSHPVHKTIGSLAAAAEVQALWQTYAEAPAPAGIPESIWHSTLDEAMRWIHHPSLKDREVAMICEVQLALQQTVDVRHSMHELYVSVLLGCASSSFVFEWVTTQWLWVRTWVR